MDIESLRLFSELIATLSADAKTMLIWWVALKHVLPTVLTFTAVMVIALVVYKLVSELRQSELRQSDMAEEFKSIRDALRVGSPGSLTHSEIRETAARVRMLIEQEKQSNKE